MLRSAVKVRARHVAHELLSSYWFIPAVLAIAACILGLTSSSVESWLPSAFAELLKNSWSGGPEAAREILSVIAASMITVAGVVFSITIVALTLASTQFGPRLLSSFMRDKGNQMVLGVFIGSFIYCMLILKTVRGEPSAFVPHFGVTLALVLAGTSLAVLIYFIHHVAVSMQVDNIIALIGLDLDKATETFFAEEMGQPGKGDTPVHPDILQNLERSEPVTSLYSGYVQAVDSDGLLEFAERTRTVIKLLRNPGHFVVVGAPLAKVLSNAPLKKDFTNEFNSFYIIGSKRTPEQDLEFAIHQLSEIAVRALSPGINDPYTAMACIDWLSAALSRIACQPWPSPYRHDGDAVLRVVRSVNDFGGMIGAAFNLIRQNALQNATVCARLMESLNTIACFVKNQTGIAAIKQQAEAVMEQSCKQNFSNMDEEVLQQQYNELRDKLSAFNSLKARDVNGIVTSIDVREGADSPPATRNFRS